MESARSDSGEEFELAASSVPAADTDGGDQLAADLLAVATSHLPQSNQRAAPASSQAESAVRVVGPVAGACAVLLLPAAGFFLAALLVDEGFARDVLLEAATVFATASLVVAAAAWMLSRRRKTERQELRDRTLRAVTRQLERIARACYRALQQDDPILLGRIHYGNLSNAMQELASRALLQTFPEREEHLPHLDSLERELQPLLDGLRNEIHRLIALGDRTLTHQLARLEREERDWHLHRAAVAAGLESEARDWMSLARLLDSAAALHTGFCSPERTPEKHRSSATAPPETATASKHDSVPAASAPHRD
jgi:hypothetical protein